VPITPTKKIWMNGTLVDWDDATVHVLNPTMHYGWGVFEGIRAYATDRGPAVFRLTDHITRLFRSARIYLMDPGYSEAEIVAAVKETVRVNEVETCYIRPLVYLGYGEMGLNPLPSHVETAIAVWPWGLYLGADALEAGCRAMTSSWQHINQNSIAPQGKGTGQYVNSSLSKVAALTRDSVIQIARDLGYEVVEHALVRTDLYLADEAFFTGTAAEVVPIAEVDDRKVGTGRPGPVTREVMETFSAATRGEVDRYKEWNEYVRD
jgi:branched-chain amino acid aminotransferase